MVPNSRLRPRETRKAATSSSSRSKTHCSPKPEKARSSAGTKLRADGPHLRLNPGDPILSANGNQGSDTQLFAELKQDQITCIVFKRAISSQVEI